MGPSLRLGRFPKNFELILVSPFAVFRMKAMDPVMSIGCLAGGRGSAK